MENADKPLDVVSIQSRLTASKGKEYWRSLEELSDTPAFQEVLHREFPSLASEFTDPVGRRKFLKLMGASLALAGLTACTRQPTEYIAPYVRQPEGVVPGQSLYFATAMTTNGIATGLLVQSHEGRPTKIEGNPDHPASLGATDRFAQASVLQLYDPDRSQTVTYIGDERPYSAFLGAIRREMVAQRGIEGAGLRILTEHVTSPTLGEQIKTLLIDYPSAKWYQYEPVGRDNIIEGSRLAFGQYVNTHYRFDQANVVLSLDADFLATGPASLKYARDFMSKRKLEGANPELCRLYTAECTPSSTGAKSDHRLSLKPSEIESLARAVAAKLGVQTGGSADTAHTAWVDAVVKDLRANSGSSIVVAGEYQPPAVHAIAHAINIALGNTGKTVFYTDPVEVSPVDSNAQIRELAEEMESGQVDLLVIIGCNPVYDAPADMDFVRKMEKVRLRVHSGLYKDETYQYSQWHVPQAHYLESWSDARAFDGTISIIQPLIAPLYNGKTAHEILAAFTNRPESTSYQIVQNYWKSQMGGSDEEFDRKWRRALHDGLIANSALPEKTVAINANLATALPIGESQGGYEIVFRPDPNIYDGRYSNLSWLQELPKTFSSLTWDNAALVSPATARALGIEVRTGSKGGDHISDTIRVEHQGHTLTDIPIWIMPGQPDGCITLHLGYGRSRAGRVGSGAGFNAYVVRTTNNLWAASGVQVAKAGGTAVIASTQLHFLMEGRDIVRSGTLERFREHPDLAPEGHAKHEDVSLYEPVEYKDYAWGMAIDLNSCMGCNACMVACQSENNIPVVGKEQVERSREMHWLRVDTYFKGDEANPDMYFQPVPCQQCENAPCEVVCPVGATAHSAEGLNDMVYNRCVGTRYCSNNCPYKVRRFNFLLFQDFETPHLKLLRNPDVTVRSRGVMEKCTYCVQRIMKAKITSEREDRSVMDGEVKTACQQVCPTEAIVFGDINNKESRVAKLKSEERNYSLLQELNTKPRTTYLGAVSNPNPELEKA